MTWPTQHGIFEAGDITLQSGARLPAARLSWKTHGTLSAARDNVIVYPTSYGAQHADLEWLIGPDKVLDPTRWFIIILDMFGNGLSSSPVDTAAPAGGSGSDDYPTLVTIYDNVQVQRLALQTLFGIEAVACVYGWSMGALQAYHWAAVCPTAVQRVVVNCGVARTAVHNQVFLRSLMATLEAAPQHVGNGRFVGEPGAAKRAFGRIYAGWALSQDFYRANQHLADGPQPNLGAPDLETFLKTDWEDRFGARPAANLYAQLRTWDAADISANDLYDGDLPAALRAIQARVLLMPGATRSVFPHRRQRGGVALPSARRATADSQHLGTPRRQPRCQSGRSGVYQDRGAGLAGTLALGRAGWQSMPVPGSSSGIPPIRFSQPSRRYPDGRKPCQPRSPGAIRPPFVRPTGYSHAVQITGETRRLIISGQVGMALDGSVPSTGEGQGRPGLRQPARCPDRERHGGREHRQDHRLPRPTGNCWRRFGPPAVQCLANTCPPPPCCSWLALPIPVSWWRSKAEAGRVMDLVRRNTVGDALRRAARVFRDRSALVFADRDWSFIDLDRAADRGRSAFA